VDPLWLLVAFILGFAATRVGLPPLVGYLIAGFVLKAMGVEGSETIDEIADLGVMLLLFSIGLKLRIKTLLRAEIWAGASLHMLITIVVFGCGTYLLSMIGFSVFGDLDFKLAILIAFALSFSSTVFAVKVLEERGEMASMHGRTSIGILIMQDIFAVLFLTFSTGKLPSVWALAVPVVLFGIRPIITAILDRCGHRELLLLSAFLLALGLGAGGFEWVGLKPDLGALVIGILVSTHPKAKELADVLLSFKDLFLVAFFLTIGLSGTPNLESFGIALLLVILVVFKVLLFILLLTRFRLRARTSFLTSLSLANYSEFGLVVSYVGVRSGWLGSEWLIIIAIALSISFILASPLNAFAHTICARLDQRMKSFETRERLPDDQPVDPGDAQVFIFGMGRIGTGAYEYMRKRFGKKVLGLDYDPEVVRQHTDAGRNVIQDDATDPDFWERVKMGARKTVGGMVLLSMKSHAANMYAAKRLAESKYVGIIAAIAEFEDELEELKSVGVHAAFNFYAEAGSGFAEHICSTMACDIEPQED
jgi:predicted Kef-type K+ transport protein